MKYYFDINCLDGPQKKSLLGIRYGETRPMLDLISIGLTTSTGIEYYAISNEFNIDEAWNRLASLPRAGSKKVHHVPYLKNTILFVIFNELAVFHINKIQTKRFGNPIASPCWLKNSYGEIDFTLRNTRWLIKHYGKSRAVISNEILQYIDLTLTGEPVFYSLHGSKSWSAFCDLYGSALPFVRKHIPQYYVDISSVVRSAKFLQNSSENYDDYLEYKLKAASLFGPVLANHALSTATYFKAVHQSFLDILRKPV